MKRVRFHSWIRRQLLDAAQVEKFSLRKIAAIAQRGDDSRLRAALFLYAHANGCVERLMTYLYDDAIRDEFLKAADRLGARDAERLALRGAPIMVLPQAYRDLLEEFAQAYQAPERDAAEKSDLCERSRQAMFEKGTSPADVARALGLNKSNTYAYLSNGDTKRFTVQTARTIYRYLEI